MPNGIMKAVGIGIVAGAVITMTLMPKKKATKHMAGKAIKAVGEVIENISDAMGI